MVQGIGHIGILVRSLDESTSRYLELFGAKLVETRVVAEQGVKVAMLAFPQGPNIELLEPLPGSRMEAALEKRGEGVQHISFDVENIDVEIATLKEKSVGLLDEKPRRGVEGMVAFLHPRSANGVLVELCQKE